MDYVKPYKVVYTRIGDQELWAGWRIAGYTEGTPGDVLANCGKLQSKNADRAKFMYGKVHNEGVEEAKEVYEFTSRSDGIEGTVTSFTRLLFGDSDFGGRTGMNASSVCLPSSGSDEVLRYPQKLLTIDRACFDDCRLDTDRLSAASGQNNYDIDEILTVFAPAEYACEAAFDIRQAVREVFPDKQIYRDFIRCIYWNLTFSSATPIYIKTEDTPEENFKIFLIAINSVLYSFRSKLSFRTFNLEDPANQTSIVFCKSIPYGERFFDVHNGKNNILSDSVINKLSKQSMEYYPQHIGTEGAEKFFDLMSKTLDEFGDRNSVKVPILETAFSFIQGELEGEVDLSDKEIIKKLITFCNLPYSNDKIDSYIARLLDSVMTGGIKLNDDIKNHIDKKLSSTKCEELIDVGNQYRARNLLTEPKESAFKRLFKIQEEDKNFGRILHYIDLDAGGRAFIDEYYGTCYGPNKVKTAKELYEFTQQTSSRNPKVYITAFIKERCADWGNALVQKFFRTGESLVAGMDQFERNLMKIFPEDRPTVSELLNQTHRIFWDQFDFKGFYIDLEPSYRKMRFSDMRAYPRESGKCGLAATLAEIFFKTEKQSANTVRSFKNKLEDSRLLDNAAKNHLIEQFRRYCLNNYKTDRNFDFWLALGELQPAAKFRFLFGERIMIFRDEYIYENELKKSADLSELPALSHYREELDSFRRTSDDRMIAALYDITRQYENELKKSHKHDRRREPVRPAPRYEDTAQTANHVDYVTGDTDGKKKKDGGLGGLFNRFKKK